MLPGHINGPPGARLGIRVRAPAHDIFSLMPDRRGPRDPVSLAGRASKHWSGSFFPTNTTATVHIEFKDTKTGLTVRLKEGAALKKLVKADKPLTPAQEHALRVFSALHRANEILLSLDSQNPASR